MAYNPNNPNGQATMANSAPVVIASDQSAVPVSLASVTVTQTTGTNLHTVNDQFYAQGSATAGEVGPLVQGAVTTAPPTYITGQTNPLSLTTGGRLRVDASGTTGATTVIDSVTGIPVQVSTTGQLEVTIDPTEVFNETFEGGVIDIVNRWSAPVVAGAGSVTQSSVAGLVIAVGTSANSAAAITTQPTFATGYGSITTFAVLLQLEATIATGNYRFFGLGTQGTAYSTSDPIANGIGYEITTAGVLRAVIYASDVLIFSTVVAIPTDGAKHAYVVSARGNFITWSIDTNAFVSPVASAVYQSPDITLLPIRFASLNGSGATTGTPLLTVFSTTILDEGRNATNISDGTYPWRRATVSAGGALLVSSTGLPTALGAQTIANSTAVNIASDQVVPTSHPDLYVTGQAAQTAIVNNILTATAGAAATDLAGYRTGTVQVISTGTAGTYIFEGSNDNVNFQTIPVYSQLLLTGTATVAAITATSSNLIYTFPISVRYVRLRIVTTITGGSIQAFSRFSQETWTPASFQVSQNTAGNLLTTATIASGTVTTVTTVGTVTNSNTGLPVLVTDVASAAITTTTTTAAFTPTFGSSYEVVIPVTVVSGTNPTLDVQVQESDDSGTNWKAVYDFPRITATGFYRTSTMPLTGNRVRYVQTVGGTTPSFTRALDRLQSSMQVFPFRQQVDRTIDPNTLNSVTPSLVMGDAQHTQLLIDLGTLVVAPVVQLEGSDDYGSTWYAVGTPLTGVASSTVSVTTANVNSALLRARISTAGTTAVLNYVLIKAF